MKRVHEELKLLTDYVKRPCNPLPVASATSPPRLILTRPNPWPASHQLQVHAPDTMHLTLTPAKALISSLRKRTLFLIMHIAAFFTTCCAYVQAGAL